MLIEFEQLSPGLELGIGELSGKPGKGLRLIYHGCFVQALFLLSKSTSYCNERAKFSSRPRPPTKPRENGLLRRSCVIVLFSFSFFRLIMGAVGVVVLIPAFFLLSFSSEGLSCP